MKNFIFTAALLLPLRAAADCVVSPGQLVLEKIRVNDRGRVTVGCVHDSLEYVSRVSKTTSTWASVGTIVPVPTSAENISVNIASRMVISNDAWVSISSNGNLSSRGTMPGVITRHYRVPRGTREYAKIENGIVTAFTFAKGNFKFPDDEEWVVTPYDPKDGSGKIGSGYLYKNKRFLPPAE